jgi:uncharacterized membrane protein
MAILGIFAAALVVFLVIDAIWLKMAAYPLFERHIGALLRDDVQMGVAAAFYVFYVAGVVYFAVLPALEAERLGRAAFNGALLGFLAYGTYEATNMATIRGWSWEMVAIDTAWGMALTAVTAIAGYGVGRLLL